MNPVKTLLSVYFDQQRGWMVYRRQMRHGLIEHEDDSPAGMLRDSTADEVALHVGASTRTGVERSGAEQVAR